MLGALAVIITAGVIAYPSIIPNDALAVPVLLASLFVGPRQLPWFVVGLMLCLLLSISIHNDVLTSVSAGSVAVVFLLGLIVLLVSFQRSRLGVAGLRGEHMFVDLRDRILRQGALPELPRGWQAEQALVSAGGTLFAGDFVVTAIVGGRFEIALVDVSGKGEDAGTRALQFSGALAGLISSVPPARFLIAANEYLVRQEWLEGFATAVHLSIDLSTGWFEVRTAGHPPALWHVAHAGGWESLTGHGTVLGLIPGAEYDAAVGILRRGDAVLLYTDGMVEAAGRDLDQGIERLRGAADIALRDGFPGSVDRLVRAVGSPSDDRALIGLYRE
jgi:hypothetical protein